MNIAAKVNPYQAHITETYFYLRLGMAVAALLFPLILWWGGRLAMQIPIQASMSAYYHTEMRDAFVGVLFAIGFALLLYKGFSRREDWALNIAGTLAAGIAVFPMDPAKVLPCLRACDAICLAESALFDRTLDALIASKLHGVCAVAFFVAIAFVCGICSRDTLHLIPDLKVRRAFRWGYRVLGLAMIGLPAAVVVLTRLDPASARACGDLTVFRVEFAGIWVFAIFWVMKTVEIRRYGADVQYPDRRSIPPVLAQQAV